MSDVINPATEMVVAKVEELGTAEVEAADYQVNIGPDGAN